MCVRSSDDLLLIETTETYKNLPFKASGNGPKHKKQMEKHLFKNIFKNCLTKVRVCDIWTKAIPSSENHNTLLRETGRDQNKLKNIWPSLIWRPNIVTMATLSKVIYRISRIPVTATANFFCANWQTYSKFYIKLQGTYFKITKKFLKQKDKVGVPVLSNFKIYYKVMPIKTIGHWAKERLIDQWSKIGSPEMGACMCGLSGHECAVTV